MKQEFEKYPALQKHIQRMASTGQTGSVSEWSSFLNELNKALLKQPADIYQSMSKDEDQGSIMFRHWKDEPPSEDDGHGGIIKHFRD